MHASRDERGALSIAGVDCRDLVAEFGSPLYVLDEQQVRVTARRYREAYWRRMEPKGKKGSKGPKSGRYESRGKGKKSAGQSLLQN